MSTFAHLCGGCGKLVPGGTRCACQAQRDRERKARHDQNRPSARARGYDSRWDKARASFLLQHPTCACCPSPATTVDHIKPHRGDMALFWDRTNWQPLCTTCHSRHKQRLERREIAR